MYEFSCLPYSWIIVLHNTVLIAFKDPLFNIVVSSVIIILTKFMHLPLIVHGYKPEFIIFWDLYGYNKKAE